MERKPGEILNQRFISRIIDSMADGVFTMDGSGRISSWNQSMEKISGYRAEEAAGGTIFLDEIGAIRIGGLTHLRRELDRLRNILGSSPKLGNQRA